MRRCLASAGVGVAIGILLFFTWRINRMENEIHDLILRDEATRLYNFRGFHMLAEHALRLAQRTNAFRSPYCLSISRTWRRSMRSLAQMLPQQPCAKQERF